MFSALAAWTGGKSLFAVVCRWAVLTTRLLGRGRRHGKTPSTPRTQDAQHLSIQQHIYVHAQHDSNPRITTSSVAVT